MPRSKHRRKPGAKAVAHPGRSAAPLSTQPADDILELYKQRRTQAGVAHLLPLLDFGEPGAAPLLRFPDGRLADASNADEWMEEVRRNIAATPSFDPVLTPAAREEIARFFLYVQISMFASVEAPVA